MKLRNLALAASVLALASCMTASETAGANNAGYDARIIRDSFGVPHIYGKRNADVAFGLAYAHSEDDWKNIVKLSARAAARWPRSSATAARSPTISSSPSV